MTKFTYSLEIDEEDDQMRGIPTIVIVHVRSGWIRIEVFKNLIKFKFTYFLPVEWDKKIR